MPAKEVAVVGIQRRHLVWAAPLDGIVRLDGHSAWIDDASFVNFATFDVNRSGTQMPLSRV